MGWPAVVQVPVDEPVDAVPEAEAGASLEPDELSAGAAAATEGDDAAAAGAATEGDDAAAAGAAAATEGDDAAATGAAAATEGDDAAAAPEAPDAPHFGPVGGAKTSALFALAFSTEFPGLGNLRSDPSAVVQSVAGMLATNISGLKDFGVSISLLGCFWGQETCFRRRRRSPTPQT